MVNGGAVNWVGGAVILLILDWEEKGYFPLKINCIFKYMSSNSLKKRGKGDD